MRIGDLVFALSAVAGLPSTAAFARQPGSPAPLRPPPMILLTCLVYVFALHGCAGFVTSESTPSPHWQPRVNRPVTIRTLGSDQRFSQLSSASVAERLRALHAGEPLNILALSGGGAFGAFGAGAMVGLTRSGSRPEFAVVTGVSAGALVAPYAFLGPTWDARLRDVYTSGAAGHLLRSRGLGVIFGSSLYSGKPLQQLVDAYASDEMVQAVAREADKGRLLLVATTDVATAEPVVWDLGSIARAIERDAAAKRLAPMLVGEADQGPDIGRVASNRHRQHARIRKSGALRIPFDLPRVPVRHAAIQRAGKHFWFAPGFAPGLAARHRHHCQPRHVVCAQLGAGALRHPCR